MRRSAEERLQSGIDEGWQDWDAGKIADRRARIEVRIKEEIAERLSEARWRLDKQARFIAEYKLPQGEWLINDKEWYWLLLELQHEFPPEIRRAIKITLVE